MSDVFNACMKAGVFGMGKVNGMDTPNVSLFFYSSRFQEALL